MTKCYDIEAHKKLRICLMNTKTNKVNWVHKANWISFSNDAPIICWYVKREYIDKPSEWQAKYWKLPEHIKVVNCDMEE